MSDNNTVDDLLQRHKAALTAYREWDEKVERLLKGRRMQDLTPQDMESYRRVAAERDVAYDQMRHLEKQLLDDIPDAATGPYPRVNPKDARKPK